MHMRRVKVYVWWEIANILLSFKRIIENSGYLFTHLVVTSDFRSRIGLHSSLCHRYIKYISFWLFERPTRSCSFHWIARNTKKFLCKVYKGGSWCLQCNLCLILPWANLFNFDVKLSNCTNTWPEWLFTDIFQRYLFIV